MISLDYKDAGSLHEQIETKLKELIVSGALTEGNQLPSVRELSVSLTVNPNTVQRAYKQLEADGFIYSIKGKGNFVSPVSHGGNDRYTDELYGNLASIVRELMYLGKEKKDIIDAIDDIYNRKEEV